MSSSYVSTVNITVKTNIERIINRTLLLPANTPYLTFSLFSFFLLNAYLVWEQHLLHADYITGSANQFESFIFYLASTCACVLLILLSISKDIFEENHRLNEQLSLVKITGALLAWCLLSALCIPTFELYGNTAMQSYISEHHLSVLDFVPKKTPFYSNSW
jgi:hypothetical protein